MAKDVGIAARLARDLGVETPFLKLTLKMWREAPKRLAKDADHSEIYKVQATLARPRRGKAPGRRERR
jgi:3-hydroxyisobutyrate dehydrogenase-like beta-hydroxyacid dehydrogenase